MSKFFAVATISAAIAGVANADTIKCAHRLSKSETLEVNISYTSILKQSSFSAVVKSNGHEISKFEKGDVDVKYLSRRFVAKNNHGDEVEGKVMKIKEMIVKIENFSMAGNGLHVEDIIVDCE